MKRRRVLAALGAAALSGCSSTDPPRPTAIDHWRPETGVDTDRGVADDPLVSADSDAGRVAVEGRTAACDALEFPSPEYESEESVLTVAVGTEEADCREASESYRVTVWFDRGVPATVVARERPGGVETTTAFE